MQTDSFGGLTREQKLARVRTRQLDITDTVGNIFSSDVPTHKRRYIVGLVMTNPDASPIFVTVRKVLRDNSAEEWLDSYEIDAQDNESLNKLNMVDVDNPLLTLTGDQNLDFDVDTTGKTGTVTIWWYDDPR